MSRVLIVSKTKMREGRVCVGGVDLDRHCLLRLMNRYGKHDLGDNCRYEIYEVWDMSYIKTSPRKAPHCYEDCNVMRGERLYTIDRGNLITLLRESGMRVNEGPLTGVFGGKLRFEGASCFISQEDVPDHSTCFWIADRELRTFRYDDRQEKIYYECGVPDSPRGRVRLPYVGLNETPLTRIAAGTLIRLSLAHWWKRDEATDPRCYLQLSGYYD